jgi:hypothetical protein
VNPALVIRGWTTDACLRIEGKDKKPGDALRFGHERHLDGDDLVIWMDMEATRFVKIEISQPEPGK